MAGIDVVADRAADILETQGHVKKDWGLAPGPRCLGGAIEQACTELGYRVVGDTTYCVTTSAVQDIVGCRDFIAWNNADERTAEEVVQVLRDVAIKHRPDAMHG